MPETEYECITKECLQAELRAISASSHSHSHSSSSSISSSSSSHHHPLTQLLAQKLILLDCRSSHEFSESRIRSAVNFFIPSIMLRRLANGKIDLLSTIKSADLKERIQNGYKVSLFILYNDVGMQEQSAAGAAATSTCGSGGGGVGEVVAADAINILYRRLKQDGCRVAVLQAISAHDCLSYPTP
ncbi:unnamed protein product [Ceratitis capitata]|uniref:(Mediterranean fruit fly) hypothetical protein n=1 Tax=Ceratitis capitata TaxID=7213 RepID=A0A811V9F6_CERCA|nr:unnamed protein product [Ceratitis capitata]